MKRKSERLLPGTQVCTVCRCEKAIDEFAPDARRASGATSACRECTAARKRHRRSLESEARSATPPIVHGVEFMPVVEWPGYWIGDDGSLWGNRLSRGRIRKTPVRCRGRAGKHGYLQVILYGDFRRATATIHSLVARAFCGLRPEGMEVRHLDGDRLNNHASNLAWGTRHENSLDSLRHKTHRTQLLDEDDVRAIRSLALRGSSIRELARRFGVHQTTVDNCISRKTWEHVQ